jgi:hypothetical protein
MLRGGCLFVLPLAVDACCNAPQAGSFLGHALVDGGRHVAPQHLLLVHRALPLGVVLGHSSDQESFCGYSPLDVDPDGPASDLQAAGKAVGRLSGARGPAMGPQRGGCGSAVRGCGAAVGWLWAASGRQEACVALQLTEQARAGRRQIYLAPRRRCFPIDAALLFWRRTCTGGRLRHAKQLKYVSEGSRDTAECRGRRQQK